MTGGSSNLMRPDRDLSNVRVQGGQAAAGVGAAAYAQGAGVNFGAGLGGAGAGNVLAHEAAHVVQQGAPAGVAAINAAVGHYGR